MVKQQSMADGLLWYSTWREGNYHTNGQATSCALY